MGSKYNALRGLHVRSGFYKSVHKGEDAWLQKPGTPFDSSSLDPVGLDIFGVFDGHGGKQAATYVSRNLSEKLLAILKKKQSKCVSHGACDGPEDLQLPEEVDDRIWKYWALQDKLAEILPDSLSETFVKLQEDFFKHSKASGTTATVAVLVGWQLVVANVGDSCAYLDTGSEVLQMSGNHRLDDSKAEQERIRARGFELSSSKVEGRPCGPLRVWPGGLAMGRTLGDHEDVQEHSLVQAGDVVLCEPEVKQATLPATGARIIIASDGLWDSVASKTAAHHARGMPASKAAREVGLAALKGKGLKDDITVLVIDFLPDEDHKLPPYLAKDGSGQLQGSYAPSNPVHIFHPLENAAGGSSEYSSQALHWQRRAEAVKSAFPKPLPEEPPDTDLESIESEATSVHTGVQNESHHDSLSVHSHSSDVSETLAANLQGNAYAIAGDELGSGGETSGPVWEAVGLGSRDVPKPVSRKHGLLHTDNSPSTTWQVPKALREAPPSPASSPMEISELQYRQSQGRSRQGRGRSRGRGRGSGGRGRHQSSADPSTHPLSINGFSVTPSQQPQSHQSFGPSQGASIGLSFLDGGGFSLQEMSALPHGHQATQQQEGKPSARSIDHAGTNGKGRGGRGPRSRRQQARQGQPKGEEGVPAESAASRGNGRQSEGTGRSMGRPRRGRGNFHRGSGSRSRPEREGQGSLAPINQ